jgi:hypothetical protein
MPKTRSPSTHHVVCSARSDTRHSRRGLCITSLCDPSRRCWRWYCLPSLRRADRRDRGHTAQPLAVKAKEPAVGRLRPHLGIEVNPNHGLYAFFRKTGDEFSPEGVRYETIEPALPSIVDSGACVSCATRATRLSVFTRAGMGGERAPAKELPRPSHSLVPRSPRAQSPRDPAGRSAPHGYRQHRQPVRPRQNDAGARLRSMCPRPC